MNKLVKIIHELNIEELELIKKDLDVGNIDRIVKKELQVKKGNIITLCPVCSAPIKEGEGLHLQFGQPTFRKKATFDGADCLSYFVENNLKGKRKN